MLSVRRQTTPTLVKTKNPFFIFFSILGISETRWIESGQCRLSTGEPILSSRHESEETEHSKDIKEDFYDKTTSSSTYF